MIVRLGVRRDGRERLPLLARLAGGGGAAGRVTGRGVAVEGVDFVDGAGLRGRDGCRFEEVGVGLRAGGALVGCG